MLPVRAVVAVCAIPVLLCVALAFGVAVPRAAALPVAAVAIVVAVATLRRIVADLVYLGDTARRAGRTPGEAADPPPYAPALAATATVAVEIGRLAQTLSDRAGLIETLLGAEETIVETLPDPLLLLGPDRAVRRANAAARLAYGAGVASVLRQPALRGAIDATLERRRSAGPAIGAGAGAAAPPLRVELTVGGPQPREVVATVLGLDPPLPGGGHVLLVLSDRTRERAIERTRSDFIANASHELRTPLTSLIGFIDTLRGPAADDPEAQAEFLAIMAEQAARMNRLIDDLLSLSRIEISEHVPPATVLDAAAVAGRVADEFAPRLAERDQSLALELPPDGLPVLADEDQLIQVLGNLLDNAVKYGRERGRIVVTARAALGGAPVRDGVLLGVSDDGPGIPRVHLPRLTERFYRAASARPHAPHGTGLGLAIVKHIINRHRGTLRIDSVEGEGATFTVWLPSPGADGARVRVGREQAVKF